MQRKFGRRKAEILSVVIAALAMFLVGPAVATAAPATSSVEVSSTTVRHGDTFTIVEQVYNPESFTVTGAKPAIKGKEVAMSSIAELVDCAMVVLPCYEYFGTYRAPVGDLPGGESRSATFTLRVRDDAPIGSFTLLHQFVGDNYAFAAIDGPVITVLPRAADLSVSLDASPRGILTSRVDYGVTVHNVGPGDATAVRLTASYPSGMRFGYSSSCVHVASTWTVTCDIASLPAGATATARFSVQTGLLALGPLTTSVVRQQSTPDDPNPADDGDSITCSAVTGLLVRC